MSQPGNRPTLPSSLPHQALSGEWIQVSRSKATSLHFDSCACTASVRQSAVSSTACLLTRARTHAGGGPHRMSQALTQVPVTSCMHAHICRQHDALIATCSHTSAGPKPRHGRFLLQALVALMKDKFESFGGTVLDRTALSGKAVTVRVGEVRCGQGTARLLMSHESCLGYYPVMPELRRSCDETGPGRV